MSLLNNAMETLTLINVTTAEDGYGGRSTTYQDGNSFQGAVTFNSSVEALRAEAQGVRSLYTITTSRATTLSFHQILRRERDGKILRVTSDGEDLYTPASASIDMRQVTAEEWETTQ